MAFPETGILDNFNRANEGPPPSASWTDDVNGLKVDSNQCIGDGTSDNISYWSASQFGSNCEVYVTVPQIANALYLYARYDFATETGYLLWISGGSSWNLYVFVNGDGTSISGTISQTVSDGDSVGMELIGSTIKLYYRSGGGAWTEIGSKSDSTVEGAGYIGLGLLKPAVGVAGIADDFGGGGLSATLTPDAVVAIAQGVAPSLALGMTPAVAIAQGVAPSLALGMTPAVAIAQGVAPSLALGMTPAVAVAQGVAPTVVQSSLVVGPDAGVAVAGGVDPSVLFGSATVGPGAAMAVAGGVGPTVMWGSLAVGPGAAVAVTGGAGPSPLPDSGRVGRLQVAVSDGCATGKVTVGNGCATGKVTVGDAICE